MKKGYTITLITVGICLAISVLFSSGDPMLLLVFFGIISLMSSVICFIIGAIVSNQESKKGFLITAGLLLLLGIGICGPMLISM